MAKTTTKKKRNPMAALREAVRGWVTSTEGRLDRIETNLHELSMTDASIHEELQEALRQRMAKLEAAMNECSFGEEIHALRQQTRQWFDALDARVKALEPAKPCLVCGGSGVVRRDGPGYLGGYIDGCSTCNCKGYIGKQPDLAPVSRPCPERNRLGRLLDWLTTKGWAWR